MDIIKEFGSYEKAKEHALGLANAEKDAYSWSRFIQLQELKKLLLEYRRDNNIFEAGDKVVFKDVGLSAGIKIINEIISCTHAVWGKEGFHLNLIRHATGEEIKANKRLD